MRQPGSSGGSASVVSGSSGSGSGGAGGEGNVNLQDQTVFIIHPDFFSSQGNPSPIQEPIIIVSDSNFAQQALGGVGGVGDLRGVNRLGVAAADANVGQSITESAATSGSIDASFSGSSGSSVSSGTRGASSQGVGGSSSTSSAVGETSTSSSSGAEPATSLSSGAEIFVSSNSGAGSSGRSTSGSGFGIPLPPVTFASQNGAPITRTEFTSSRVTLQPSGGLLASLSPGQTARGRQVIRGDSGQNTGVFFTQGGSQSSSHNSQSTITRLPVTRVTSVSRLPTASAQSTNSVFNNLPSGAGRFFTSGRNTNTLQTSDKTSTGSRRNSSGGFNALPTPDAALAFGSRNPVAISSQSFNRPSRRTPPFATSNSRRRTRPVRQRQRVGTF
ncbi:hypothetical protein O3P69_008620 [Scylla paramamosain]|uniref:Uncharacterized protein n=1 Tax=Scylla paramamosain TaxID=85552 RepID=A0AAW0SKW0_SCYPA